MKKSLLICILVLVLCASVLVACTEPEAALDDETLTKLIEVIDVNNRNNNKETPVDYQLPASAAYAGKVCKIKWTATNGVTVSEPDSEGYVTVNVNEEAPEDINYKITATLVNDSNEAYKNAEGKEYSVSFDRVTKQFIVSTYEQYVANCKLGKDSVSINIKGFIAAIILPSSKSSSKGSMYIQDADGHGYYAYGPTLASGLTDSDEKILAAYPIGAEVYVSGTSTIYSGQYEFNKGCSIRKTGNMATAEQLKFNDGSQVFAAAADHKAESLIPFQNAMVELKDCTMTRVDDKYYYFKVGASNVEFNLYKTNYFMSEADLDTLVAKFAIGDKATFKGIINVYSSKYQVYPLSTDAISEIDHIEYSDEQKVAMAKEALTIGANIAADGASITLPATGEFSCGITWEKKVADAIGTIAEGKYTVATLPEEAVQVVLVATIKSGTETDTKEFTVEVYKKQPENGVVLNAANMGLAGYASKEVTVNGVKVSYTDLGHFDTDNHIQAKASTGTLCNTVALAGKIVSVQIQYSAKKSVFADNVIKVEFATKADFSDAKTQEVKTVKDVKEIPVTIPEGDFTFIRITNASGYAMYFESITIMWEAPAAA